jgi:biotin transport system substrate-specific component
MSPSATRPTGRLAARDLALIALFAALIAALSMPFAIPVGPVPITLQTLGVMLAPCILGARRGVLAVLAFLALGLAGLPLFAGGRSGIGVLVGPTGGYLIGWIVGALVIGLLTEMMLRRAKRSYSFAAGTGINILGGILVIYAFGVPWTAIVTGDALFATLLGVGWFLPGDLAKAVIAAAVAAGVHRAYPVPPPVPLVALRRAADSEPPGAGRDSGDLRPAPGFEDRP